MLHAPLALALLNIVTLCQAPTSGVQSSGDELARRFATLELLLQAQLPTLRQTSFEYSSNYVYQDGTSTPAHIDGWWAIENARVASFRRESHCEQVPIDDSWRWTVWDGASARKATNVEESSGYQVTAVSSVRVQKSPLAGALSYFLGGPIGLFYWHQPWATVLDGSVRDVRPVATDDVDGAPCLVVLFDAAVGDQQMDGIYQYPAAVWLDSGGSPFARRIAEFRPSLSAQAVDGASVTLPKALGHVEELEGFAISVDVLLSGIETVEGTALKYPQSSDYIRPQLAERVPTIRTTTRHATFGKRHMPIDPFQLPVVYPLALSFDGQSTVVIDRQDGSIFGLDDLSFMQQAQTLATAMDLKVPEGLQLVADEKPNCLVDCAVLLTLLPGKPTKRTRSEVSTLLPASMRSEGAATIEGARQLLAELFGGVVGDGIRTLEDVMAAGEPSIAGLTNSPGELHFAIVAPVSNSELLLIEPGQEMETISADALMSQWSGYCFSIPSLIGEK